MRVLPAVSKATCPAYTERPFWSLRFRITSAPPFRVCAPFTHVTLSPTWMSVVGEISARATPLKLA